LILIKNSGDDGLRLQAHHSAWTTSVWMGEPARALQHSEAGQSLYNIERHKAHVLTFGGHDPGVCARQVMGWAAWLLGYPDRAKASADEAMRLAEQLGHPLSMMVAYSFGAVVDQFRREPAASLRHIGAAETVAAEQRLILFLDPRVVRGGAMMPPDAIPAAVAGIREGLAAQAGTKLFRPYSLGLLCEALCATGDHDGALAAVTEGLTTIDATGERWWEAELHRLRGLLLMARGDIPEAEATLQRAIRVAGEQQATSLELRAATSLAGLWAEQGRRAEAHDLLAPVYGWFTEGFDTPDLKGARVLLDELA
jgi:predicted ATPase